MSSMNRNNGSRASGKKKFGKNLSKVTKAPAPPVPSSANARGATSRNGLLLLSTKRATSSNNNNAGGLLSSKTVPSSPPKKAPPLTLTTESSYTSAHDALLGAVIGASRMTDTQQPPDAWGIAEKQTSTEQKSDGVVEEKEGSNRTETTTSPETKSDEKEAIINRNAQEEARFQEQRERAAERLRQLEEKMSKSKAPVPVIVTQRPDANANASPLDHWNNGATPPPVARPRTRTLFDPNAPDGTSPAGQSNTEKETRVESSPTMMDQEYSRKDSNNRISHRGDDNEETAPTTTTTTQPVIHISNYETRDRGERDKNAGPRMLFDPKSGSMVAADEGGRSKKVKPKGRKDRPRQDENGDLDNGGRLKRRGRGRDKKSDDGSTKDGSKKRSGKIQREPDRLPRTCGVLYKRDELGNCVCVDGCESGDLGYGAHSVPGGRVRNPDEYEKFVAQQKAYEQEGGNGLAYGLEGYGSAQAYYTEEQAGYMAATKEPEMKQKEIDWVKPDEKIELVTGEEDSPTLQATAHSFFPSQAALAAAAAAKEEDGVSPTPMMTGEEAEYSDEEEDDDDDHPESFVGLGFDPTENMDSVMQSPSVKVQTRDLDPVQLAALSLEGTNGSESASRNLFAFGSTTWGGGNSGPDWASPAGVSKEGQDKAAGAASFLSLSSGNPWGSSGISSGFGGGPAMPGSGGAGQGSTGD